MASGMKDSQTYNESLYGMPPLPSPWHPPLVAQIYTFSFIKQFSLVCMYVQNNHSTEYTMCKMQ